MDNCSYYSSESDYSCIIFSARRLMPLEEWSIDLESLEARIVYSA
jgi:hypothetical protein